MESIHIKMPRYQEIPNVGLYLEQTVKYINQSIEPLKLSITASMLSNYVKQGYVDRPIRKQYYADRMTQKPRLPSNQGSPPVLHGSMGLVFRNRTTDISHSLTEFFAQNHSELLPDAPCAPFLLPKPGNRMVL